MKNYAALIYAHQLGREIRRACNDLEYMRHEAQYGYWSPRDLTRQRTKISEMQRRLKRIQTNH